MSRIIRTSERTLTWRNTTGASVGSGAVVSLGNRWGVVAPSVIANNAEGVVVTEGLVEVAKQAADAFAAGATVWWDSGNGRASTAPLAAGLLGGMPLGVVHEAPAANATRLAVRLGEQPATFFWSGTGNITGGGVTIDTGFGATPITWDLFVRQATGEARAFTTVWGSGGTAGRVTITGTNGAAGDLITFSARRGA